MRPTKKASAHCRSTRRLTAAPRMIAAGAGPLKVVFGTITAVCVNWIGKRADIDLPKAINVTFMTEKRWRKVFANDIAIV